MYATLECLVVDGAACSILVFAQDGESGVSRFDR
jgi:hypothetical protein